MKKFGYLVIAVGLLASSGFAEEGLTKPPTGSEWISLFNGKNLDGWKLKQTPDAESLASWVAVNGQLINRPPSKKGTHGIDLVSDVKLGSHEMYIEFRVPAGSNSGVYLMGDYEVQVLDSYKKDPNKQQCGGIYNLIAPSENASKAPGYWQCYHAIFHAPRVNNGKIVKNPQVTVYHNGVKVIDNKEIPELTGASLTNGRDAEAVASGPTYLQGNHGDVDYRNIYYKPIKD